MPPNFDEITTTTLRNRKMAKKPQSGQPPLFDKGLQKRSGMTPKQYEGSPQERRSDIRDAVKKAVSEVKGKPKK